MKLRPITGALCAPAAPLAALASMFVAGVALGGCALEPAASDPVTPSEAPAASPVAAAPRRPFHIKELSPSTEIRGGVPVNGRPNPISALFPLSTVQILTASNTSQCTGVILSSTKILTAAHCQPDSTTTVVFYGPTGATPVGDTIGCGNICLAGQGKVTVAMPDGVTGAGGLASIFTGGGLKDTNGNWADLAVLTLPVEIPETLPWGSVGITPSNSFAAIRSNASWAVGTGDENDQPNPKDTMEWVAGSIGSADDSPGYFETDTVITDQGDSGGPLFQLTTTPGGGLGDLVLVGILTGQAGAIRRFAADRYTSVGFPSNYTWIQQQLATGVPGTQRNRIHVAPPQDVIDLGLLPGASPSTGSADQRPISPFPGTR